MTEQMRHDATACGAMRACLDSRHMQSYLSIEGLESKKRDPMGQGQYPTRIQSLARGVCPENNRPDPIHPGHQPQPDERRLYPNRQGPWRAS